MQTIFCLMAARTLQSGNGEGKKLKRSEKLFSFQKHFASDKVTIKLFGFVVRKQRHGYGWHSCGWFCTKTLQVKTTLLTRCRFPCRPYYGRPPERAIVDRKTFSNFCFRFPTWRKVFPVHANALNSNHGNIIIKNTTEVQRIKSFQRSIKCQPDMNQLGCLAFRHLSPKREF